MNSTDDLIGSSDENQIYEPIRQVSNKEEVRKNGTITMDLVGYIEPQQTQQRKPVSGTNPYNFRLGLDDTETYGEANNNPFTMGQSVMVSAWIEPEPIPPPPSHIIHPSIAVEPIIESTNDKIVELNKMTNSKFQSVEPVSLQTTQQNTQQTINLEEIKLNQPSVKGIISGMFRVKPQEIIQQFGAIIFDPTEIMIGRDGKYKLTLTVGVRALKCRNSQAEFRLVISGEGIGTINIPMIKISSSGEKKAVTMINLKTGSVFKLVQMEKCKVDISEVILTIQQC